MRDMQQLQSVLSQEPFSATERTLVSHFRDDWNEVNPLVLFAAACSSLAVREGHTYFDLAKRPPALRGNALENWPSIKEWKSALESSEIVCEENSKLDQPLVFADGVALYLEKYYTYEQRLSALIRSRVTEKVSATETDPVAKAVRQNFFVITGGPGTGKTTLALRYLDRVLSQWSEGRTPRFAAIAPTGKAAARLSESIAEGLARVDIDEDRKSVLAKVPCLTIHRLLGALPFRTRFRHNEQRPVPYDAIIIDESSMIDLPLMTRLFQALPAKCQVLMLGDRDQLSSVEVGSVFADILGAAEEDPSRLQNCVETLTTTYRFSEDSTIYRACQAARLGDSESFRSVLESKHDDWNFHLLSDAQSKLPSSLIKRGFDHWQSLTASASPEEALQKLTAQIVLAPTKTGPFGSREINRQILNQVHRSQTPVPDPESIVHATPIIVLENDYELEVFNGDLGLLWLGGSGGAFAYFTNSSGGARRLRVSELPRYEPAFALTIHKSQGSEFDQAICVFGHGSTMSTSRELVYTAFSRARKRLVVFGHLETLEESVRKSATRATRLAKLLV